MFKTAFAADKGVLLAPTRVVLEGRKRSTTVQLINPYDTPCTYTINLVNLRMDDSGNRKETDQPNAQELLSRELIRFSPRRVTVGPNGWQTIRLMVRKPSDLPDGEYRVHMKVAPIPDKIEPDANEGDAKEISFKINYVFNVTIPIIIRHGSGTADVEIPFQPVLKKDGKKGNYFLETRVNRTGSHSVYGDILLYHTPSSGTKAQRRVIGQVKGFSIYTPNRFLNIEVPLSEGTENLLSNGQLEVEIFNKEKNSTPIMKTVVYTLTQ